MSKKPDESPKVTSKPDDLIKSKTKEGRTELTEQELGKVTGGLKIKLDYKE